MKIYDYVLSCIGNNACGRFNCLCGGINTLSISSKNGTIKWYCFRASCKYKGIHNKELSVQEIKNLKTKEPELKPLELKDCVGWNNNLSKFSKVIEYLEKNHCIEAYLTAKHKFYYDEVKDRIVFCEQGTRNNFTLAIGRGLSGQKPKWHKYVAFPGEYYSIFPQKFEETRGPLGIIVEDTASACSASRVATSIALCGTIWDIKALVNKLDGLFIKNVIVCLDKDAQTKAAQLRKDLVGYGKFKSVKVVQTSDDIKYLAQHKLEKELQNG